MKAAYKIALYLLAVVVLGLLQTWVAILLYHYKSYPLTCERLLQDGAVFFFSSSIAAVHMFLVFEKLRRKGLLTLSLLAIPGAIILVSVIAYSGETASSIELHRLLDAGIDLKNFAPLGPPVFTGPYTVWQVVSASVAIIHGLLVNALTGQFK